jgi:hypothetical protein
MSCQGVSDVLLMQHGKFLSVMTFTLFHYWILCICIPLLFINDCLILCIKLTCFCFTCCSFLTLKYIVSWSSTCFFCQGPSHR